MDGDHQNYLYLFYDFTCPQYQHYATCKHTLGAGLQKKLFTIPPKFDTSPFNDEARRRGRPRKAQPALQRQNEAHGPLL